MGSRERGREQKTGPWRSQSLRLGGVAAGLGIRLRKLRTSAGLSQTELAAGRFSKEYLSQIERGKTRPTAETVAWLAERLGVDADLLLTGISGGRAESLGGQLARAEALSERYEFAAAAPEFAEVRDAARAAGAKELELRALTGEGWARLQDGELKEAAALLAEARTLSEEPQFSDIERADVPLPARRLPLPAVQHLHGPRPVRRRSRARRPVRAPRRPAASADLPLAVPLLPPAARLASSSGRRRACARAGRGP